MAQLHCYVPEEIAQQAQRRASPFRVTSRSWSNVMQEPVPLGQKDILTFSGSGKALL